MTGEYGAASFFRYDGKNEAQNDKSSPVAGILTISHFYWVIKCTRTTVIRVCGLPWDSGIGSMAPTKVYRNRVEIVPKTTPPPNT